MKSSISGRGWYVTADLDVPSLGANDDLATWPTTDLTEVARSCAGERMRQVDGHRRAPTSGEAYASRQVELTDREEDLVEVGVIETDEGRTLHVCAKPGSDRPFVLGVSGRQDERFTVGLTAFELEHFLTLLEMAGRAR